MSITDSAWLAQRGHAIATDGEFRLAARHADFRCLLDAGERRYLLTVRDAAVSLVPDPTMEHSYDFAVRASSDAWDRYISGSGGIEYRDVLAMAFQGTMSPSGIVKNHFHYEGNFRKLFANLHPLYVFLSRLQPH